MVDVLERAFRGAADHGQNPANRNRSKDDGEDDGPGIANDLGAPVLSSPAVARELARHRPSAREVVLRAVAADLHVPAVSQTLEYCKYETSTRLPTRFTEAQLDFFGHHMFAARGDPVDAARAPRKGAHHYEWLPARGIHGT